MMVSGVNKLRLLRRTYAPPPVTFVTLSISQVKAALTLVFWPASRSVLCPVELHRASISFEFDLSHARQYLMSTDIKNPLKGRLQKIKNPLKVFDHQIHQKLATHVVGVSFDAQ